MSKVITKSNFRVVVEPKTHIWGLKLSSNEESDCRDMVEQIKRHVDNIQRVYVDFDTTETCSHCKLNWEVSEDDSDPDFPKGTPVCCQAAIDEYNAQKQQS